MAGHDVLAITLRAILYHLAQSPKVLAKLRAEIASVNELYSPATPIPYSQIVNFTYL